MWENQEQTTTLKTVFPNFFDQDNGLKNETLTTLTDSKTLRKIICSVQMRKIKYSAQMR